MGFLSFSNVFEALDDVLSWISSILEDLNSIFADVDFGVLYSWLPNDVRSACSAVILVLLFLALMGLLKKAILFLG